MDVCVFGFMPCTFHGNLGRFRAAGDDVALVAEQTKRSVRPTYQFDDAQRRKARSRDFREAPGRNSSPVASSHQITCASSNVLP